MSYLSVSTWSLHRLLGPLRWTVWDTEEKVQKTVTEQQTEVLTLLELPAEAARRGYRAIEICHFHFPSIDPTYLNQLKNAFSASGIGLDTLLLDYGDITSPDESRVVSDFAFIRKWIEIASLCGAKKIRVIAGEAPPTDERAIHQSAERLLELSVFAASQGVEVITENFKSLTSTGASCLSLLERTDYQVRTISDFGNFTGQQKYKELSMTMPYSASVHAKPQYDEHGYPDELEFQSCLNVVKEAGYEGSIVLIYDGPGDMWEGLERVKRLVEAYL